MCFIWNPPFDCAAQHAEQPNKKGVLDRAVADAILHRKRGALFVQRRLPIQLPLNAQYLLYLHLLVRASFDQSILA
jgi:hypothetical protein